MGVERTGPFGRGRGHSRVVGAFRSKSNQTRCAETLGTDGRSDRHRGRRTGLGPLTRQGSGPRDQSQQWSRWGEWPLPAHTGPESTGTTRSPGSVALAFGTWGLPRHVHQNPLGTANDRSSTLRRASG